MECDSTSFLPNNSHSAIARTFVLPIFSTIKPKVLNLFVPVNLSPSGILTILATLLKP